MCTRYEHSEESLTIRIATFTQILQRRLAMDTPTISPPLIMPLLLPTYFWQAGDRLAELNNY